MQSQDSENVQCNLKIAQILRLHGTCTYVRCMYFRVVELKTKSNVILQLYTNTVINPQPTCTPRVTVLGICVCVSVTQHLTLNVIIHATNDSNLPSAG